jgi:hypothetical protein
MSMATITSSAARAADSLYNKTPSKGSTTGIIIGLCLITLFSNIVGVRVCIYVDGPNDGEYADCYHDEEFKLLRDIEHGEDRYLFSGVEMTFLPVCRLSSL